MNLARFRADPTMLRVGVRLLMKGPRKGKWFAIVQERHKRPGVRGRMAAWAFGTSPKKALVTALRAAKTGQLIGLDLDLQWAYPHPFGGRDEVP